MEQLHNELTQTFELVRARLDQLDARIRSYDQRLAALDELRDRIGQVTTQVNDLIALRAAPAPAAGDDGPLFEPAAVDRLLRGEVGKIVSTRSGARRLWRSIERRAVTLLGAGTGRAFGGVGWEAQERVFLFELLADVPVQFNAVDYLRVTGWSGSWSPHIPGLEKPTREPQFEAATALVRYLASTVDVAKSALQDVEALETQIAGGLLYDLRDKIEAQVLSGDGTGQNLHGIIPQAAAFDPSFMATTGWNFVDCIGAAIAQIESAGETRPNVAVLHPQTWFDLRRHKGTDQHYIFGPPVADSREMSIFGLRVVTSPLLSLNEFLVGSTSPGVIMLRTLEPVTVEASTEEKFSRNLVAIRAETRKALVLFRPAAWVHGTISRSPAS